jgi:hypothetical protein
MCVLHKTRFYPASYFVVLDRTIFYFLYHGSGQVTRAWLEKASTLGSQRGLPHHEVMPLLDRLFHLPSTAPTSIRPKVQKELQADPGCHH